MSDHRTFDARVVGSITSGILMIDDFSKVHEAIEFIAGYPVWTHELPRVCREVCAPAITALYPDMPQRDDVPDWLTTAAGLLERYPDGVSMPAGTGERSKGPVETLVDAIGGADNV